MKLFALLRHCVAGLLLLAAAPAFAHQYEVGSLVIHHPWARATPPGAQAGGVFMDIKNSGEADELVAVKGDIAKEIGIHEMKMDNGVMRMSMVKSVLIPAKGEQQFQPGGYHIMLTGLKAPLKEGDKFPLTLVFKHTGEVQVSVKIEAMGAQMHDMH